MKNKNEDKKLKIFSKNCFSMIIGYRKMGRINLELSNEFLPLDNQAQNSYEQYLAESEKCDSKTRRYILR